MFTIDAHLDLSMNAMEWNRDLRLPIETINSREAGRTDKPDRGNAVVSFSELRKGNIGLVVATQIARYVAPDNPLPGWHSPEQAWAQTQGQLAWYKAMEAAGEMVQVKDLYGLEQHLQRWLNNDNTEEQKPIGYILSLEGADSIVDVGYLEGAYEKGLRAIGPAHYGPGRYAQGTNATGKMGPDGYALLAEMERLNIILDATHLSDESFWDAMDHFNGPVWASHNNCRALVDHNRQFTDEQIRELISRGAVIGAALDAWMMVPGWERGVSTPKGTNCNLEVMINHIDHICQLAGSADHVGIGSDLDAIELEQAVRMIAKGQTYISPRIKEQISPSNSHQFTNYDLTVISLLAAGMQLKEIPGKLSELSITPNGMSSMEKRLNHIKTVLNFKKNEQLIAFCKDMGII